MGDYRGKIPVWVVFLLLANILLAMGLEVLLLYRTPLPLTQEALAEADSRFDGAVLSESRQRGYLHCALAETANGDIFLIPVRSHGVFFGRGKLLKKQIVAVSPEGETSVDVKVGIHTATITLSDTPEDWTEPVGSAPLYLFIDHSPSAGGSAMAVLYLALGLAMTLLELFVLRLLKGH